MFLSSIYEQEAGGTRRRWEAEQEMASLLKPPTVDLSAILKRCDITELKPLSPKPVYDPDFFLK